MATPAPRRVERLDRDRLLDRYRGYGVPRERWRVGGEFERHMLRPDGHPVPYHGAYGIRWLLDRMVERGWQPKFEGELPIALHQGESWITLEPGSQFELSGAPFMRVADVVAQARAFIDEVKAAIGDAPIRQVALGFTPFARIEDVPWAPKGRYELMKRYLAGTGDLAHHMMKGTAAVQASYDFSDEADCARKVAVAVMLGPLTTALFANSPLYLGKPSGYRSYRGHVWTRTDPARTGFPEVLFDFSYEGWVDWLVDVPMMFTAIDGRWTDARGRTFRQWMEHGIDGAYPTDADWELHLTSVFPEVRIKRTIEVRGADCVPIPLAAAFVALFKGLFYCERALRDGSRLAAEFASHGTRAERFDIACRHGLQGVVGGRPLTDWAAELLAWSRAGVQRCEPADLPFLEPLEAQVARGESPADAVLRAWQADPTPRALLDAIALHA